MENNLVKADRLIDYLREFPNFLSVFIFSMFYNIASPMLLDMSASTGMPVTDLNLIFTFYTVGAIAGQLTSVLYNRKFAKLKVIVAGYIFIVPLIILLNFAANLFIFYIVYLLSGYILGVIWIQSNQFVLENSIKNKERIVTILLSFYPVAALISPILSSNIIKSGFSWRFPFYIIVSLIIINICLYLIIYLKKGSAHTSSQQENTSLREIFTSKYKNIVYCLIFLAVIFYCYSETIIATWIPTYLRQVKNFDIQSAALTLTIFWLFIIIGRAASLAVAGRVKTSKIIIAISVLAVISFTVLIFLNKSYLIYIFAALSGLGYSAMFPLLISAGSTIYLKGRGVLATGLFIASNIGISAAPFFTKYTSAVSPLFSVSFAPLFMALVTIIIITVRILNARFRSVDF
jgi:MFS transporter, FHS family, glucose/mannose:H+ symporter